ncbi:squalene--hopene cyclase [Halobacillus kuroshimensis]|uniref:Squalene--hopene cyclase n=1 Tax=Halobacillus kuroshimensis TaxID=302481 RepID=A0ABS3DUH7_9BACI|nr:prenyltransferase/squalene oxidase repeat-containing protein [Halobacillus kuroshimensis]MBN8234878.1 squalene--hopene cyclase [Halobacillus kuroshimensis]
MKDAAEKAVSEITSALQAEQDHDGHYSYCFENSLSTDVSMILLLHSFTNDASTVQSLCTRLASLQHAEGWWSLYHDEKGNLSATIEASFALLYAGFYKKESQEIQKAFHFIRAKGGLRRSHSMTKIILAIYGEYEWPHVFHLPVHISLLPPASPLSFYDFSSYARVHMAPILLMSDKKFRILKPGIPDFHTLNNRTVEDGSDPRSPQLLSHIKRKILNLAGAPEQLYWTARKRLESYMIDRIESDGTLYSYTSSTVYMIYALLSCGYKESHPVIQKAISGLRTHLFPLKEGYHMQNSPSAIWDTALAAHALALPPSSKAGCTKALSFLLQHQQYRYGDWVMGAPSLLPGGWGFSKSNSIHPDIDDTTAALRALTPFLKSHPSLTNHYTRGLNWVLGLQNEDGGWPAFEKGKTNPLLRYVPMDGAEHAALDPSTADLTGRTLEFLCADGGLKSDHPSVKKAVHWLTDHQEKDGSWYGRWGVCFIYGTWAALTGMAAAGKTTAHPAVLKAAEWLMSIQNTDGGWGESCRSDQNGTYSPLGNSTPSQTAWALDALLSVYKKRTPVIDQGVSSLLKQLKNNDWSTRYPTGAGLPGNFYIHYHSYNAIWPLIALKKYLQMDE